MALNIHLFSPLRRSGQLRPRIELSSISVVVTVVTVVTAVVMALVTIATVAIVLGWVVVWRVGWCRWGGGRIQANDTAAIFGTIVGDHDGSADEAVLASKVLQESIHRESSRHVTINFNLSRGIDSQIVYRASSLSYGDVRILQRVEHWTNLGALIVGVQSNVSVLVDGVRDNFIGNIGATRVVRVCALDLNRVAWELAEV